MLLGSTVSESSSDTSVDSALSGSQVDASLFWTSASLAERLPAPTKITIHATSTIHLVTGPVSLPAI